MGEVLAREDTKQSSSPVWLDESDVNGLTQYLFSVAIVWVGEKKEKQA